MLIGQLRRHPPTRRTVEKANLDQKRLVHLFKRILLLRKRRSQRVEPHRAAVILLDDRTQQTSIQLIKTVSIDLEQRQRSIRRRLVDHARRTHLRVVAHAPQQPVGDARSSTRAHRDLRRTVTVDRHTEHVGRAFDDKPQLVVRVELQAQQDAEPGPHRRAQESGPGGGGDKREGLDVQLEGLRRGARADHDVQPVVLKSGVELLLQDRLQPVDLVEEQHLLVANPGQNRR